MIKINSKVINNIHLPEFIYIFFFKLSNVFAAYVFRGRELQKIGDRYAKCVARIHMK